MVKPAEGRAVRDPNTKELLPREGRNVPNDMFWRRRLRDGDVVMVQDEAPAPGSPVQLPKAKGA
jgi:hypothetical protein